MNLIKKVCFGVLVAGLVCSCSKSKPSDEIVKVKGFDLNDPVNQSIETFRVNDYVYAPAGDAFELDYSAVKPEKKPEAKRLEKVFVKNTAGRSAASVPKSVRKLSDYKIKYNETRKNYKEFIPSDSGSEESSFWDNAYTDSDSFVAEEEVAEESEKEETEKFYLWCDGKTTDSSEYRNHPICFHFNTEPDPSTLKSAFILTDPYYEISSENMELKGKNLIMFNLPVYADRSYKILVLPGIKSKDGLSLSDKTDYFEFFVSRPSSYFKLCDTGRRLMESQFPHRIAFKFKNLKANSGWKIEKTKNPLKNYWNAETSSNTEWNEISSENPNRSQIDGVEFDDLLDEGFGWVTFTADYNYEYFYEWKHKYEDRNETRQLSVQVTDLGATARIGINRALVLVSSLSKNIPVSGAEVDIVPVSRKFIDSENDLLSLPAVVSGKTDRNGLADIVIPEEKAGELENCYEVVLIIKNGKDKIAFFPTGSGYSSGLNTARRVSPSVFLFCDRGLYKPGETITFRGIDKNRHMGHFSSYHGKYKIQFQDSKWRNQTVYETLSGETSESGGFYGSFKIPEKLVPGTYVLNYKRDEKGENFEQRMYFHVRYFEAAKIQTDITIPDVTYYGGDTISAQVEGSYLAGGALSGADFENSWYKNPVRFSPDTPESAGYTFGPEEMEGYKYYLSEQKGKLNHEGKTTASYKTDKIQSGTTFMYRLESSLTDISNQKIGGRKTVLVHPAKYYIGVAAKFLNGFAEKGKAVDIFYILVKPDGTEADSAVAAGNLSYTLKRISWEVSNVNGVNDNIYSRYHKVETVEKNEKIKISSKGNFSITPENSGEYVLTLSGTDKRGNPVITDYEFYVTGRDSFWYNSSGSEKIDLTFDKKMYNPGDKAKVLLKSDLPAGKYLITVEREGIYTSEVRSFDSPCNVIEVPVAMNYVPYAYVCVSSYSERKEQPDIEFGQKDMEKPKSYYGEACLEVNPYVKAFSVDVQFDKTIYRPGETATVFLTATKDGNALPKAELTVMGVDRSVLDLVNYHVQNPIEYFYDKYDFKHCVIGGDSRDMLMDPVTYAIKNLAGGDADEQKSEEERRDFRPTAFFEPAVVTDENGKASFSFVVPSQLTTYRVTAVGVRGELFGIQEDEFGVRNPINVQSVQPRRLRVRDTAECGVLITNLGSEDVSVSVQLDSNEVELHNEDIESGLAVISGKVFVDGENKKTVTIAGGNSDVVYFDVGALEAGEVELCYTVDSAVLSEKLISRIKIEKSYSYDSVSVSGKLLEQENVSADEKLVIPSWAHEGEGELSVSLDTSRLGLLSSAVQYVFDYPYGCIEQRTSKVLPLVLFEEYISAFGLNSKIRDTKQVVKSHFDYIKNYQKDDGGFGYWPESPASDFYVSLRVAELCNFALNRGWKRSDLKIDLDRLENYLVQTISINSEYTGVSSKAYGYYILSASGYKFDSGIAELKKNILSKNYKSYDALALLGLSYTSEKNKKLSEAKVYADLIRDEIENFHSDEFLAHALKLFVAINPDDPVVDKALFRLLISQKHGYWSNTRATAAVLDAVYDYIKAKNLNAVDLTAKAKLAGVQLGEAEFKGVAAEPVNIKFNFHDELLAGLQKDELLDFTVEKEGSGQLYYSALMKYALPDEMQNFRDKGIYVGYKILDSETDKEIVAASGSKVMELEAGKTYTAQIVVSTKIDRDFIALRAPVPSGAEILDTNFVTVSSKAEIKKQAGKKWYESWGRRISSQALYDNEAHFFWDRFEKGNYTLEFQFRANRRGVYPVPPVQAELMYEPEVYGRSDGYLFVIK